MASFREVLEPLGRRLSPSGSLLRDLAGGVALLVALSPPRPPPRDRNVRWKAREKRGMEGRGKSVLRITWCTVKGVLRITW